MGRQFARLQRCRFVYSGMGYKRPIFQLLGELANGREYGNYNSYFSDGLCDPEQPKPGWPGSPDKAG